MTSSWWPPLYLRRAPNRAFDALIGATPADVAGHRGIDLGVGRAWRLGQQRRGGHDLTGLAIATLRNLFCHPCHLQWMGGCRRQTFDGGDLLSDSGRDRGQAGTGRGTVNVHGARTALTEAAAEFRAGETQG